jgi:glycosyltransferase involved in cell wall biosynthesis
MIDITWAGPMDISGYGSAARSYIRALEKRVDVDLKIRNTSRVPLHPGAIDASEIAMLNGLLQKPVNPNTTTHVCETIAEHFPYEQFKKSIGYTVFETETLHRRKAAICNSMDEVWCPSAFNKEGFIRGGVTTPIRIIPHVVSGDDDPRPIRPNGAKGFNFVFMAEFNWRKGWDIAIKAFCNTFEKNDDVSLTLKFAGHMRELDKEKVYTVVKDHKEKCKFDPTIVVIANKISSAEVASLLSGADAFVLPTRGEAWGLTLSEAMFYGTPTIGTNWGGNLQFMNENNSYLIDINGLVFVTNKELLWRDRAYSGQKMCEPSQESLAKIMAHVVNNQEEAREMGAKGQEDMQMYSPEKIAQLIVDTVEGKVDGYE